MAESTDVLRLVAAAAPDCARARIEPDAPVFAGSLGTWTLTVTTGPRGIATGGAIAVETDSDSDWGGPQVEDPRAPDYLTVAAPLGAEVVLRMTDHLSLLLLVTGRSLRPGEELAVTYGDRRGGGPGSRAQTFLEERRRFWVSVDADGTGVFAPLADPPWLQIVGGGAARLVLVAPSTVAVGEAFALHLKAEDAWGNPASSYRGHLQLQAAGMLLPDGPVMFAEADGGVRLVDGCRAVATGVHRIAAADAEAALHGTSNPVLASRERPSHPLLLGRSARRAGGGSRQDRDSSFGTPATWRPSTSSDSSATIM